MTKANKYGTKKLYRPRISKANYNTVGRYSKFIRQFIDVNVWGVEKRHRSKQIVTENLADDKTSHQLKTKQKYTLKFTKGKYFGFGRNRRHIQSLDDIFLIDKDEHQYYIDQWSKDGYLTFERIRKYCIETHLIACQEGDPSNLIYYTNNPNSEYALICLDFDDVEDFDSVIDFMSEFFPNCYYEKSSGGDGLHYYIMVQFDHNRYWSRDDEGTYRNRLFELLTEGLSDHVDYFDGVKATCPEYDINDTLTKCGTLCCLPSPVIYEQFQQLYGCSVYNELYLYQVINYMNDLTCHYYDYIAYPLNISTEDIKCPPILIKGEKGEGIGIQQETTATKKKTNKANTNDSFIREMSYISNYIIESYKLTQSIPSEEKVYQEYISENNYSKLDEDRQIRFHNSYEYFMKSFNPELIKSNSYQLGMYLERVKWTDKQLTEWANINTSYKRKIYRKDVDVALGYIFVCGKNIMNVSKIKAINRLMKQDGVTYEQAVENLRDTAGVDGLMKFFAVVKEQNTGCRLNSCGKKKAIALFKLLEHLDLVECIDASHYWGVCRKYRLK